MKVRWSLLGKDACALFLLAAVSVGLGMFARSNCRESRAILNAAVPGSLPHPAPSLEEFRAYVQAGNVPVFDVRNRESYLAGHVPGAISLPTADFYRAYTGLKPETVADKQRLLLVYCSDTWCGQGDDVQQKLIDLGHRHVGVFRDGWAAWVQAGLPTEKAP